MTQTPPAAPDTAAALLEVRVSVPDAAAAQRMASDLVVRQLAACVQVLGPMASVYTWKGEVHQAQEWLLLVKTTDEAFPRVAQVIRDGHRYHVPEIMAVPVSHALDVYADWVRRHSGGIDDGLLTHPDARDVGLEDRADDVDAREAR